MLGNTALDLFENHLPDRPVLLEINHPWMLHRAAMTSGAGSIDLFGISGIAA
jgi:hypothetical protein